MSGMKTPLPKVLAPLCFVAFPLFAAGCGPDSPDKPPPTQTGTRVELADESSLALLLDPLEAPVFGDGLYHKAGSYDRETGAPPPAGFVDHGNRDMNQFACRGTTGSVSDAQIVPPQYDVEVCPESYVQGVALARIEGSGRMTRLWLTASSLRHGAVANDEILRIWVDDDPNAVVEEPLAAIIDGSAGEMFAPPFGDGPGDHVAWYYPVVFGKKIIVGLDNLGPLEYYYDQVDVVLDTAPVARKAASQRLDQRDKAIAVLQSTADYGQSHPALGDPSMVSLMPGQTTTVMDLKGPATITSLRIDIAKDALATLLDIDWQLTWDDAAAPAMSLPMSDLFVAALESPENGNASLGFAAFESGGKVQLELRLPMPFSTSAKAVLTNNGANPASFVLTMRGEPAVPSEPFGHLYVDRNESQVPAMAKVHPLTQFTGRGKWAGTCAMLQGRGIGDGSGFDEPLNFLEGDDLGLIDGMPVIRGTGTEDYFNGAFYFESGSHATPFAQWWGTRVNGVVGQTNACRFHLLADAIDISTSADVTLEIGPGVPETLERYRTVAFVYR